MPCDISRNAQPLLGPKSSTSSFIVEVWKTLFGDYVTRWGLPQNQDQRHSDEFASRHDLDYDSQLLITGLLLKDCVSLEDAGFMTRVQQRKE